MCEQCEDRALLWYDEPLNSQTVRHLWQRVGIDISSMLKIEDGNHQLVIAWDYLSGCAEA